MERVVGTSFRLLAEAGVEVRRVVCGRSLEHALTVMAGLDHGAPAMRAESLRS
jgi:hypothetical protein